MLLSWHYSSFPPGLVVVGVVGVGVGVGVVVVVVGVVARGREGSHIIKL